MAYLHFDNISIAAMAGALPTFVQEIPRDPAHPRADYIKSFIKQTGISRRHISITEQTATDLGFVAVQAALEKAGWQTESLDGVVFLTQTPDFNAATGNAYIIHNHLNLKESCFCLDIAQGCASFPYGLSVCGSLLQQAHINRIAMISGDTMWAGYLSRNDLLEAPTFLTGDGSTAVLLEKKEAEPINMALYSDGSGYHNLYNPWDGVRHAWRRTPGILPNGERYEGGAYMDGMEITSFSTMRVVDSIQNFLAHINKPVSVFDGVVLHQANKQIVRTMGRRLKVDSARLPMTMESLANTNGASVTLTIINEYAGQDRLLHLLISAFGIGLSWGIVELTLQANTIVPMLVTDHLFKEDFLRPLEGKE